jgi:hypothetical protein
MAKVDPLNETSEITFARSAPPHPNPAPPRRRGGEGIFLGVEFERKFPETFSLELRVVRLESSGHE